ncbi:unnamed protein product [Effrenium voratum]|uniref:Uncharacterized protein n=1 Tax=Effrenium voratum TaxID=2562239 RepID=A0AA36I841_9DINO|nr:unnamed protein product [Effrenium voratum]
MALRVAGVVSCPFHLAACAVSQAAAAQAPTGALLVEVQDFSDFDAFKRWVAEQGYTQSTSPLCLLGQRCLGGYAELRGWLADFMNEGLEPRIAVLSLKKHLRGRWLTDLRLALAMQGEGTAVFCIEATEGTCIWRSLTDSPKWKALINCVSDTAPAHVQRRLVAAMQEADARGVFVSNGVHSFHACAGKVAQHALLRRLRLPSPNSITVSEASGEALARAAASCLRYPLLLKPNAGGFGNGIQTFAGEEELIGRDEASLQPAFGEDGLAILQEHLSPAGGSVGRIWMLGGEVLCAVRAPAMALGAAPGASSGPSGCMADGRAARAAAAWRVPEGLQQDARRIVAAAQANWGSIEVLDVGDGRFLFFDLNLSCISTMPDVALVADPENLWPEGREWIRRSRSDRLRALRQLGILDYGEEHIDRTVRELEQQIFAAGGCCSSLASLTIPNSVTEIGDWAFAGCSSLTSMTIPDSVTDIGDWAFQGCSSLASVTIPDSVTEIRARAFQGCSSLASVTIPDSVSDIGDWAFEGCSSLASVTIPDSVTNIGDQAFSYCSSLASVTIPDSVTDIGDWAFEGCSSLASVTIPKSVTDIGKGTFAGCSSLVSVTIPDSVTEIRARAFRGCSSLASVTIPNSVTDVGDWAFAGCSSLANATIPDSVDEIGEAAFEGCCSLPSVGIPTSVTEIREDAFQGCSSLASVTIPDSVTNIGDEVPFKVASLLTNVTTPNSVTEIRAGCSSWASVTIPDSVTNIGDQAFSDCSSLASVTIPDSVTDIGDWAFQGCRHFYLIQRGTVVVTASGGGSDIEQLHPSELPKWRASVKPAYTRWDYFGERGLLLQERRSATCQAGNLALARQSSEFTRQVLQALRADLRELQRVNLVAAALRRSADVALPAFGPPLAPESPEATKEDPPSQALDECICLVLDADEFFQIVGHFRDELERRMQLQDLNLSISDLQCKAVVGRGTFGVVRLVTPKGKKDAPQYALKCVKKAQVVKGRQERAIVMEREANVASGVASGAPVNAQCYHPCIVQFIKTFQDKHNVYFLTEFLGGGDLFYAIRAIGAGALTKLQCQFFAGSIALGQRGKSGLAAGAGHTVDEEWQQAYACQSQEEHKSIEYLHGRGIMYRDLKPENASVLLDFAGRAKLVDFGCCKKEIRASSLVGTPEYLAPEAESGDGEAPCQVIKGKGYTKCIDWWSLGVMLYEFVAGPIPFGAGEEDQMKLFAAICEAALCCGRGDPLRFPAYIDQDAGQVNCRPSLEFQGCSFLEERFGWDALAGGFFPPPWQPDAQAQIKNWEARGAFQGCSSLASVTIPNSVTVIGYYAFRGCSSLASVTIADSVTEIGHCAFEGCSSLASVTIPNSVTQVGDGVFADCSSLASVTVPISVTQIGDHAFAGCSLLASATIPNSVNVIGDCAFRGCSSLASVTIPNSVTEIGDWAFHSCSSLASLTIPNSVTQVGDGVFADCSSLASVTIPNSVIGIGNFAFRGCSSLASVTIPNSVTGIGDHAFADCSSLASVTIPNSVNLIEDCAFRGCSSLASMTIPNSVTEIREHAFQGCCSLASVAIPNSVTGIGDYSFAGCSLLASVTIPNSVTAIGDCAFRGCSSLASVTIPDPMTEIGDYAFAGCRSLASVTIPNSVTAIGDYAFTGCSSLASVTIPESVTEIGDHAFAGCSLLEGVTIPNSETCIGVRAFEGCIFLLEADGT